MKPLWRYLLVFFLALGWFSSLQSWGGFADPDAFYHAKMAALMAEHGPLVSFPWLDLTALNQPFADQHFLFHVYLIPFAKVFGMLWGAQIAGVIAAAFFCLFFYWMLRTLHLARPEIWFILLVCSVPLITRLSLAKASPFALLWFCLGLSALLLKRRWMAFLAGLGFALTHGGWPLLFITQIAYLAGVFVFEWVIEQQRCRDWSWRDFYIVGMTGLGVVIGFLFHPNARALLSFLWIQIFHIGVATPFAHVPLGTEWLPLSARDALFTFVPLWIASILILFGFLFCRKTLLDHVRGRQMIGWSFIFACLLALTFKSQRFSEYLVPVWIVWLALLWSFVEERVWLSTLIASWRQRLARVPHLVRRVAMGMLVVLGVSLFFHEWFVAFHFLRTYARPFDQFAPAMRAVSERARPGDRVFHASWDEFPQLVALDDRLKFISGMDPTFLWVANPILSDTYLRAARGEEGAETYRVIHDVFGARFVFLEPKKQPMFARLLEEDSRFQLLVQDDRVRVYVVHEQEP